MVYVGPKPIEPGRADHTKLDLVVLKLAPADAAPTSWFTVDVAPDWPDGGPTVFTVGYPANPGSGAGSLTLLEELFRSTFGYKRLAPGLAGKAKRTPQAWTAGHDATTLGGNSGSVVVVAGRPRIAVALHYAGSRVEPAENWGHVLGRVLDTPGEAGRTLMEVFVDRGVTMSDAGMSMDNGG